MKTTKNILATAGIAAALALSVAGIPQLSYAATGSGAAYGQDGSSDAQARLKKSQFKDVKVTVENGIATLTGTVSLYQYKKDAANRVRKVNGVTAVRNDI